MDKELDLTTGVIWKQLLLFFFPILIGTFFQQLYNTVDTVIVGKYVGTNALAAVGSTGNLINLIVNFFIGLSSGATVVIAQFYGSNDDIKVSKAVHTSIAMSFICGVVMMIFGLLFSRQCLNMIGVPGDIINDATLYMKLYFLSMIPGVIYNIGAGILRAIGDSKTSLYYLIVCSGVNVFFDLLFVAYFKIGVAGAAIATVVAQFVCAFLVMRKLIRSKHSYQLRLKEIKIDTAILKRIIKIGIPAGIQSTMYSISNIVLQTSINAYGTNTIASWAAYVKIDALFWMVMG
ncbi:MAG: MATE family efflux transporter, partial [Thomasclavelia spiroformis]